MKFIGQYIQDFIARFRSDVYLEDVSTGTIASGANLGLDSNNKIVKNTVGGGGTTDLTSDVTGVLPIANGGTNSNSAANARTALGVDAAGTDNSTNVTLAGTPDYITISGQEITRNQIDLANDVTGTLAAGNVATLNQSTTGSAATLTTERDLQVNLSSTSTDGFDGGSNATDIGVKNALAVGNGGTGATTLTSNSVLTGNGTSAIQAESGLTYSSGSLFVGDDDDGVAQIRRTPHSDDTGGSLYVRGGDATAGQTDKDGGILRLYGGRGTSNGNGGGVTIFTSFATGSTGTVLHNNARSVASFRSDGDTILGGNLTFEGPVIDGNDTTFSITEQTANRTITVPDSSGTLILKNTETLHVNILSSNAANTQDYIGYGGHYNFNIGAGTLSTGTSKSNNWASKWSQYRVLEDTTITKASAYVSASGNFASKLRFFKTSPNLDATTNVSLTHLFDLDFTANASNNYVEEDTETAGHSLSAGELLLVSVQKGSATSGQVFAELSIRLEY